MNDSLMYTFDILLIHQKIWENAWWLVAVLLCNTIIHSCYILITIWDLCGFYFVVQKLVLEVDFIAFWYTNYNLRYLVSIVKSKTQYIYICIWIHLEEWNICVLVLASLLQFAKHFFHPSVLKLSYRNDVLRH